jgi:hypothetical protein
MSTKNMSDWNNPEGLKKLRLKLSISRMLSNRRIVYSRTIQLQTRTENDTLFKQAVDELVKEGCATRIKGRDGGEMLEYVPAKTTYEQGRTDILAAGKPQV